MPRTEILRRTERALLCGALASAIVLLAGCGHRASNDFGDSEVHEHVLNRGVVPAADEFSLEAANQICAIDSLTQARDEMRTVVREARVGSEPVNWSGQDYSETTTEEVRSQEVVTARPYGRQTETVELFRAFETDLDAAYRFATSSCQAYAMCMHQRGYNESECAASRLQWNDARSEFTDLSQDLSRIRLEIQENCNDCHLRVPAHHYRRYAPHRRHHGRCADGYCDRPDYDGDDCENVLGDVFTTSRCDYRDPHYGYDRYH